MYVDAFASQVEERKGSGHAVITEAAYLNKNGELAREGDFGLPARADVIVLRDDSADEGLQVETGRAVSFSPITFAWNENLKVTVAPFEWNWCEVSFHSGKALKLQPLLDWFEKWFDPSQESGTGESLLGVVHYMSDPVIAKKTLRAEIDFGSAPAEAFEALLDAAVDAGATSVRIGSTPA